MKTVGLCMIARNEAAVIERALDSALPFVDYVLVVDTGSSDGTQEIVERWIVQHKVAAGLVEEPWQNFAYNRTHALAQLREVSDMDIDYALVLDADDVLCGNMLPEEIKGRLTADCYNINMVNSTITYALPRLLSNRKPFVFRGPVHEFVDCAEPYTQDFLPNLSQRVIGGGARSQDPHKYVHDALLLTDYLRTETDPFMQQRYRFYLAQSWRDAMRTTTDKEDQRDYGNRAINAYAERAGMGGWQEEVYLSWLNVARLREANASDPLFTLSVYKQAIEVNPQRAEAICDAAKMCRLHRLYNEGYEIARRGVRLSKPAHGLFIEDAVYDWSMLDEYSLCAYYAGRRLESWLACMVLLRQGLPDRETRERIEKNLEFASKQED